jgi:hypothetical protein
MFKFDYNDERSFAAILNEFIDYQCSSGSVPSPILVARLYESIQNSNAPSDWKKEFGSFSACKNWVYLTVKLSKGKYSLLPGRGKGVSINTHSANTDSNINKRGNVVCPQDEYRKLNATDKMLARVMRAVKSHIVKDSTLIPITSPIS